jgi:hypothetical protein
MTATLSTDVPPQVKEWMKERMSLLSKRRSPLSRRLSALRHIDRTWQLRRLRYGPTGRRPVDVRLRARLEGGAPGAWRNPTPASTPPPTPP